MTDLKLYHADYYKSYGYGAYDEEQELIAAHTEAEALGYALDHYPETTAEGWTITKLETDKPGVVDYE